MKAFPTVAQPVHPFVFRKHAPFPVPPYYLGRQSTRSAPRHCTTQVARLSSSIPISLQKKGHD